MNSDWVRDYFKIVDTLDADAIAAHFTDDGQFRFGNQPLAIGKSAVRDALAQFFETIQTMNHESTRIWRGADGNSVVNEYQFCLSDLSVHTFKSDRFKCASPQLQRTCKTGSRLLP